MKHLKQIVFEITQACNMRCKYCVYGDFYPFHRNHSFRTLEERAAREAIDFIFELLKGRGNKRLHIGFYGGEPLLYFDRMTRIVKYLLKKFNNWKLEFYLTSNGTLLSKEILDFFIKHDFKLMISLDGPKENHDMKRVFPSGKGSFDRVYRNLALIKERSKKYFLHNVTISTVFSMDLSFQKLYDFFISDRLISEIPILLGFVNSNKTSYYDFYSNKRKEFQESFLTILDKIICKIKKGREIKPIEEQILNTVMKIGEDIGKKNFTFLANSCLFTDKIYIGADAKFYICEKMGNNLPIGQVGNGLDFKRMSEIIDIFQNLIKEKCFSCPVRFLCNRCYATFADKTGFSIDPDFCQEKKEKILKILELYVKIKNKLLEDE